RTRVSEVIGGGHRIKLEALRNFPVVKDLTVEMTQFFDKWKNARGYFEPGKTPAEDFAIVPPASKKRREIDEHIECIGCGVAYSACDVVAWDKHYLGPAALNRAWTLVNDVRDKGNAERLDAISQSEGCQACHTHMSCTEFCPKSLAPTYSIAGLKRAAFRHSLWGKR